MNISMMKAKTMERFYTMLMEKRIKQKQRSDINLLLDDVETYLVRVQKIRKKDPQAFQKELIQLRGLIDQYTSLRFPATNVYKK